MTKIKKGVQVWLFSDWYLEGTCCAKLLTITSWGKKQGTATHVENGKNIESRIYVDRVAKDVVLFSDMADPSEEGMRRAVRSKAEGIAHYLNRAHWFIDASDSYHIALKAACEKLMATEPKFTIR